MKCSGENRNRAVRVMKREKRRGNGDKLTEEYSWGLVHDVESEKERIQSSVKCECKLILSNGTITKDSCNFIEIFLISK